MWSALARSGPKTSPTSSTPRGRRAIPKGVQVPHQSVARLFSATQQWFEFGPNDVWTLFHAYAFDVSVWEIWGALLHGGRLVVLSDETRKNPGRLLDLLERESVTVLCQTPSAFYPLMAADDEASPRTLNLRRIIFAGEALSLSRLSPWYGRHDDQAPVLVNMYGTTETTVHATYFAVSRSNVSSTANLIGELIPDLAAYVLDAGCRRSRQARSVSSIYRVLGWRGATLAVRG